MKFNEKNKNLIRMSLNHKSKLKIRPSKNSPSLLKWRLRMIGRLIEIHLKYPKVVREFRRPESRKRSPSKTRTSRQTNCQN